MKTMSFFIRITTLCVISLNLLCCSATGSNDLVYYLQTEAEDITNLVGKEIGETGIHISSAIQTKAGDGSYKVVLGFDSPLSALDTLMWIAVLPSIKVLNVIGIEIPESVNTLGVGALLSTSMTSVIIPESVRSIGEQAFVGSRKLQSISIPKSVTSIGDYAFWGCEQLQKVDIQGSIKDLPRGIFFGDSCLVSVTLPQSVTTIGEKAFDNCVGLEQIELPKSLQRIEDEAFLWCRSLKEVKLPESLSYIGADAFVGTNIKEIVIPDSVTSLGRNAFGWCESLSRVRLPDTLTEIPEMCFQGCPIESINIPTQLTTIGDRALIDIKEPIIVESHVYVGDNNPYVRPKEQEQDNSMIDLNGRIPKNNDNNSSVVSEQVYFRRVDDVQNYLSKHTFTSADGITLKFNPSGIVASRRGANSRTMSGAIRITLQNEVSAFITAHSPYDNSDFSFLVNCRQNRVLETTSGTDYLAD